ncbi:MAG: class I SAM-dependent methyltransferase [Salinivenus sp.]
MSSTASPAPPSDHLLRTLASVPVSNSVLDLGCGEGRHTVPLLRLGFPVHACDPDPSAVRATQSAISPLVGDDTARTCVQACPLEELSDIDEAFDWIICDRAERYATSMSELKALFQSAHTLLAPGGWLFVTVPSRSAAAEEANERTGGAHFSEDELEAARSHAGLSLSREPSRIDETQAPRLRALYRRTHPGASA